MVIFKFILFFNWLKMCIFCLVFNKNIPRRRDLVIDIRGEIMFFPLQQTKMWHRDTQWALVVRNKIQLLVIPLP